MSQQHVLIAVSHYYCRSRRIPVESVSGRWQRNDVAHPAANAAFIFARPDFVKMHRLNRGWLHRAMTGCVHVNPIISNLAKDGNFPVAQLSRAGSIERYSPRSALCHF